MDAREYLAQQGLDGKPSKRPQLTLEEKSWARARAAGEHRPRAGTPHDWEDWERYHDQLADGAGQLEQKVDPDGELVADKSEAQSPGQSMPQQTSARQSAVEHYRPDKQAPVPDPAVGDVGKPPLKPLVAYVALGVLLPPLGVWLADGGARRAGISLVLTLLGWVPGAVHALYWILRARDSN